MFTPIATPRLLPFAALASGFVLAGCDGGAGMEINGQPGVPLSEIVVAGPPPSELVLASGDTVILTEGPGFAIKVEGTDTESLRFVRDGDVIGVTRESGWTGESQATVRITMPAPREVIIAGAGTVRAPALASMAEISIGGSGLVEFGTIAADKLGINIGGTGTIRGAGTAKSLEVNIGGNGDVELPRLKADTADVTIGGAGDVAFASDGVVSATIAGTGDVVVTGTAKCSIEAFGTGTLTCNPSLPAPAPAVLPKP